MAQSKDDVVDNIVDECRQEAIHNFGTGYIFEKRAHAYKFRLKALAVLGIGVPALVGIIYLTFTTQQILLDWAIYLAGILGVAQVILSVWSLTSKWEDGYSYSIESKSANYSLSERFRKLAKSPPLQLPELKKEFNLLEAQNAFRSEQDDKHNITDKEKRMGMRAGLRQFDKACIHCGVVPVSMKPTKCDVCGNF